jgi:hypothetical protein
LWLAKEKIFGSFVGSSSPHQHAARFLPQQSCRLESFHEPALGIDAFDFSALALDVVRNASHKRHVSRMIVKGRPAAIVLMNQVLTPAGVDGLLEPVEGCLVIAEE